MGDADAGLAERLFWSGHANPGSVWSLFLAYPVLVWGVYRRDPRVVALVALFAVANPQLFPPPADEEAWATRVVEGERAWLAAGVRSSPGDLAFVLLAAPVQLQTFRAAWHGRRARTAAGTALSMALMLVFFRRMARLRERMPDRRD